MDDDHQFNAGVLSACYSLEALANYVNKTAQYVRNLAQNNDVLLCLMASGDRGLELELGSGKELEYRIIRRITFDLNGLVEAWTYTDEPRFPGMDTLLRLPDLSFVLATVKFFEHCLKTTVEVGEPLTQNMINYPNWDEAIALLESCD